jgi:hypothetical protein
MLDRNTWYLYALLLLVETIDYYNILWLFFMWFYLTILIGLPLNATLLRFSLFFRVNMKHAHASLTIFALHFSSLHYVCNLNALIHGHSDV